MSSKTICSRSGLVSFTNRTALDDQRLRRMCLETVAGWRLDGATVQVRYSRSADFSGACHYQTDQIYINLGRHLSYPYRMNTHLAKAQGNARRWWKPIYTITLADGYQVVLFIFLHECFHLLVKRARRNIRQKESMADRFAARVLVDRYGAVIHDRNQQPIARHEWDFQDLERFIGAARRPVGLVSPSPTTVEANPGLRDSAARVPTSE